MMGFAALYPSYERRPVSAWEAQSTDKPLPPADRPDVVCFLKRSASGRIACPVMAQIVGGSIMKIPRRKFLHLAAGTAALPVLPRAARAQAWPSRPVRIVVGFPAG